MKAMSRVSAVWGTLLALNFIPSIWTHQDTGLRVKISIYEVPFGIVSRTVASHANPDGSVTGTMAGGATTAKFPKSSVLLENYLSGSSSTAAIKRNIREYMAYGCVRSQDIRVFDLAEHELVFDNGQLRVQETGQDLESYPYDLSYHLRIEPAWKTAEDIGLAVQLWMDWRNVPNVQPSETLRRGLPILDQTIPVKLGQTSLAGFRPTIGNGPKGSVYWLALSADKR
ncbi:MAG: hypothetical protein A2W03_13715 [Candidatus Aminicenantes bacterium RBG_16_63_16]|nr:MAG: hypothetical protein A2W03_13715 [Candidatus Aminicenantes bacterium RBG_16_63_16]